MSISRIITPCRSNTLFLVTAILLAAAIGAPFAAATNTVNSYPHATETIGSVRQMYSGTLEPKVAVNTFRNIERLFATRTIPHSSKPLPLPLAHKLLQSVSFSSKGKHYKINDYLALNRIGGLLIIQDGRIKLERYRLGNTFKTRWMSMSVAKSITSTLIGAAIKQGYISSLSDSVTRYVPSLADSAYEGVTVRDTLMMSSGVKWNEAYTDPSSDRRRLLDAQISQVPGSAIAIMKGLSRMSEPGMTNNYNTGDTQVVAEILYNTVGPLAPYLYERIWNKVGMEADAKWWIDSPDGVEIGGSGFSATLRDYGRLGIFLLKGGVVDGEQILPTGWLNEATRPTVMRDGKPLEYGYLWWTGTTPDARRDHAYMAEGIFGQYLYINPAAQVIIVVFGAQTKPTGGAVIEDELFFDAVVDKLKPKLKNTL